MGCDRPYPCAPCTRIKTECVFPVCGRVSRRGRDASYPKPPVQKQVELVGRLRRAEAMAGDLSSQVEDAAGVEQIFEAVHGPTDIHFDGDSSSSTMSTSSNRRNTGYYNFLLSNTSAAPQREDLNPLPSQMLFLWQTYMDNVDPFMKVLHVPTMTKVIRELIGNHHSLSPSMQALMLVISLAAIVSLEDEEAHEQADLLNNRDIIVLQALTIYLVVLQDFSEMRCAWFLAGVLVRVTVSMKLHCGGSHFANSTPFETEMRRRVWWQICFIDSQSEDMQVSAYKISEGIFDTEIPANTNDASLDPGMSRPPVLAERWTGTTVFLIRCEIWKLPARLESVTAASYALPPDNDELLELLQQFQAKIEDTYHRHLNLINLLLPSRQQMHGCSSPKSTSS
ncbi:MAG: hypothetical protein Q9161_001972 [Pseudevernia consocians]